MFGYIKNTVLMIYRSNINLWLTAIKVILWFEFVRFFSISHKRLLGYSKSSRSKSTISPMSRCTYVLCNLVPIGDVDLYKECPNKHTNKHSLIFYRYKDYYFTRQCILFWKIMCVIPYTLRESIKVSFIYWCIGGFNYL